MLTQSSLLFEYETPRLILKILQKDSANMVLDFLTEGALIFEASEPPKHEEFYTQSYQRLILEYEQNMLKEKSSLRFWIFEKANLRKPIGTVVFSYVKNAPFHSCMIGYKLLPNYWKNGYAQEAISRAILIALPFFKLHRIEAYVLAENQSSISLLRKLHFEKEGTLKNSFFVQNEWRDHELYAFVNDDFLLDKN